MNPRWPTLWLGLFWVFLGVTQLAYGWLLSFSVHRLSTLLHLWVLSLFYRHAESSGWVVLHCVLHCVCMSFGAIGQHMPWC